MSQNHRAESAQANSPCGGMQPSNAQPSRACMGCPPPPGARCRLAPAAALFCRAPARRARFAPCLDLSPAYLGCLPALDRPARDFQFMAFVARAAARTLALAMQLAAPQAPAGAVSRRGLFTCRTLGTPLLSPARQPAPSASRAAQQQARTAMIARSFAYDAAVGAEAPAEVGEVDFDAAAANTGAPPWALLACSSACTAPWSMHAWAHATCRLLPRSARARRPPPRPRPPPCAPSRPPSFVLQCA